MKAKLLKLARAIHKKFCDCGDINCQNVKEIYAWLEYGDGEFLDESDADNLVEAYGYSLAEEEQ